MPLPTTQNYTKAAVVPKLSKIPFNFLKIIHLPIYPKLHNFSCNLPKISKIAQTHSFINVGSFHSSTQETQIMNTHVHNRFGKLPNKYYLNKRPRKKKKNRHIQFHLKHKVGHIYPNV